MSHNKNSPDALAGATGAGCSLNYNSNQPSPSIRKMQETVVEALRLAGFGMHVFPVLQSKAPACPTGFKAASTDSEAIRTLFASYPAPLIGMATGEVSGIDVLDLDLPRHVEPREWYAANSHLLAGTRANKTRSGGLHLLYKHSKSLRCSVGRPVVGVDVRANGGYIVWWPAAGFGLENDAPAAEWPDAILEQLNPPCFYGDPADVDVYVVNDFYIQCALDNAVDAVQFATEGTRNSVLNREAWSLLRFVLSDNLNIEQVVGPLAQAASFAGLSRHEITVTIKSALSARGL